MEKNFVLNQNKLRIKKCCASCIFKTDPTKPVTDGRRWCKTHRMTVINDDYCNSWQISEEMAVAGGGDPGHISKPEYIQYFRSEWTKESTKGKTAQELRLAWERQHGSSSYM